MRKMVADEFTNGNRETGGRTWRFSASTARQVVRVISSFASFPASSTSFPSFASFPASSSSSPTSFHRHFALLTAPMAANGANLMRKFHFKKGLSRQHPSRKRQSSRIPAADIGPGSFQSWADKDNISSIQYVNENVLKKQKLWNMARFEGYG